ncbi:MAG: shikimate kinase [Hyphomicrobiaceae bacterium]|nr:shikimate kinase [Hyphomicrobiaceae bacterium]
MRFGLKHRAARKRSARQRELLIGKLGDRSIVLVGLMGAGKTVIGRLLARQLKLPFVDADHEIEAAAGMSIKELFAEHGEAYFRDGERKVIRRILESGPQILATGGGAIMNKETREAIARRGVTLWLNADLDVLMERVSRRSTRPLLQTADPRAVMKKLLDERYPVYRQSNVHVTSRNVQKRVIVTEAVKALCKYLCQDEDEGKDGNSEESKNND